MSVINIYLTKIILFCKCIWLKCATNKHSIIRLCVDSIPFQSIPISGSNDVKKINLRNRMFLSLLFVFFGVFGLSDGKFMYLKSQCENWK